MPLLPVNKSHYYTLPGWCRFSKKFQRQHNGICSKMSENFFWYEIFLKNVCHKKLGPKAQLMKSKTKIHFWQEFFCRATAANDLLYSFQTFFYRLTTSWQKNITQTRIQKLEKRYLLQVIYRDQMLYCIILTNENLLF